MSEPRNYSANQQKIIKRYYDNLGDIKTQRLSDLVGELYLSEGKKKEKAWKDAEEAMAKLNVPAAQIKHLMQKRDPVLLAELIKTLDRK